MQNDNNKSNIIDNWKISMAYTLYRRSKKQLHGLPITIWVRRRNYRKNNTRIEKNHAEYYNSYFTITRAFLFEKWKGKLSGQKDVAGHLIEYLRIF